MYCDPHYDCSPSHDVMEPLPCAAGGSLRLVCPVIILEELSTSKEARGISMFFQWGLNSCPPGETHYHAYVSVYMCHTFDFLAVCNSSNKTNGSEHEFRPERRRANLVFPHDSLKRGDFGVILIYSTIND